MTMYGRGVKSRVYVAMGAMLLLHGAASAWLSTGHARSSHQARAGPDKHAVAANGWDEHMHMPGNGDGDGQRRDLLADYAEQASYMKSAEWKMTYREKLRRASEGKPPRGILIPAGGEKLLTMTFAMIKVLRDSLQCSLPIEVVYSSDQDMSADWKQKLEASSQGVRCVDAGDFQDPRGKKPDLAPAGEGTEARLAAGDMQKIFALCCVTSFEEVILVEADSLPLRDPEDLCKTAAFKQNGSLFWPGHWSAAQGDRPGFLDPAAYTLFGLEPPWVANPAAFATAETGQLLIDRVRHADVLDWLWFLTRHHSFMFKLYTGDTESFRLAFHLAGKGADYAMAPHRPAVALSAQQVSRRLTKGFEEQPAKYLFAGILHYDLHGHLAFLHRMGRAKSGETGKIYRHADHFTVSLSPEAALGYTDNEGDYFEARQVDPALHRGCQTRADMEMQWLHNCEGWASAAFPVPIMPMQTAVRAAEAIALDEQLLASHKAH